MGWSCTVPKSNNKKIDISSFLVPGPQRPIAPAFLLQFSQLDVAMPSLLQIALFSQCPAFCRLDAALGTPHRALSPLLVHKPLSHFVFLSFHLYFMPTSMINTLVSFQALKNAPLSKWSKPQSNTKTHMKTLKIAKKTNWKPWFRCASSISELHSSLNTLQCR